MKNCTKCNYRFTIFDKLRSGFRTKECLKCPECNSLYKPKMTFVRITYMFFAIFSSLWVNDSIKWNSDILKAIATATSVVVLLTIYNVIPHKWHKYEKIS